MSVGMINPCVIARDIILSVHLHPCNVDSFRLLVGT